MRFRINTLSSSQKNVKMSTCGELSEIWENMMESSSPEADNRDSNWYNFTWNLLGKIKIDPIWV